MRRLFAVFMVIVMLFLIVGDLRTSVSATDTMSITPFTMVNWDEPDEAIANVYSTPQFAADGRSMALNNTWTMSWSAGGNIQREAQNLKAYMDSTPEGSRFIYIATYSTFVVLSEDVIYHDAGVAKLKNWLTEFLTYYKSIGGKLDGIALDTEYDLDSISNIVSGKYNEVVAEKYGIPDKYDQVNAAGMLLRIQNNSEYPRLRQMLADEGFVFYEGTDKSELCYMLESGSESYSYNRSVWNKVMTLLKREYLHEAIYDPLLTFYEDALVSDYEFTNSYSWQKTPGAHGYYKNVTGNGIEIGNTSNLYTYAQRPSKWFYAGNDGAFPPGYNKAIYEDNAFGAFLYDMQVFKDMQAALDEDGNLNAYVTYYDYNYKTNTAGYATNTVSGTAYHTETLYHIGLMNPKPFLGYVVKNDIKDDEARRRLIVAGQEINTENLNAVYAELTADVISAMYQDRLQNLADIMAELTRVAGASDREPIPYAGSWNSDFVISGMYAGGRNIWRISPDTTRGVSLEEFKVKDQAPTFHINGQTVIFPQGRILEETRIEPYGSCGYWVETPVGVEPVVINDTDRHSENPAYEDNFSTALKTSYWATTGTVAVQDGALALSGSATLKNKTVPKRVTAGDNYAKRQAWEVTVTLPASLDATTATLLSITTNDGFKVSQGKLWYSNAGTYQELATLTAGGQYTLKRELDFTTAGAYKSSFYVYNAQGQLLAQQSNVPMASVTLPVAYINFSVNTTGTEAVLLDDYKLYPLGVTTDFELYDATSGYKLTGTTNTGATAYRLSWMNATDSAVKATVTARYYDDQGTLVTTQTVCEFTMSPGADGVKTQIVPLAAGTTMELSVSTQACADTVWPDYDNGDFNWTVGVASVNGQNYETLAAAIANANGATVTLQTDITTSTIHVNGTQLTIDLAGKTLTSEGNLFSVTNGGALTVTGGELVSGATAVYSVGGGSAANEIALANVSVRSNGYGVHHNGSTYGAEVTVTDSVIVDQTADGAGVFLSGGDAWAGLNELTVIDSTVQGATAVEVKFTDAAVSGSTLVATGTQTVQNAADGHCTTGYAFALTNNNAGMTKGVLNLSGVAGLVGIKADTTVNVINNGDAVAAPEGYCWTVANALTAHDNGGAEGVVTPPTCTQEGYTTHTCILCGGTYVTDQVPALGHTEVTHEELITNFTYDQAGTKKVVTTCAVCHEILAEQTVELPAASRNIEAGAGVLSIGANTANAARVYYGGGNPWSVIGYNGTGVASGEGNLTLFSRAIYDVYYFSDTSTNGNKYAGSWLKKAIDRVAADNFSAAELAAVVRRDLNTYTVWQGSGDNKVSCDGIAGDPVLGAALWPLSTNELSAIPKNANLRLPLQAFAYVDGNGNNKTTRMFWLRSPGNYATTSTEVGYLYNDSTITSSGNRSGRFGAVPAFNLDLDSVLFASAATGGKAVSGIAPVTVNATNEWKLTLLDAARTFAVTNVVIGENDVTVTYTGAVTGDNEYISVLIQDELDVYTHYGRVAAVTAANGTVTIDLSGIDMTGKSLYVFNEQYNGGVGDTTKLTDYASSLVFVCLHDNVGEQTDCTEAVLCPDCGQTMIAAGTHTLTQVAAQAPTCTEAGWNAYEYCTVCDHTTFVQLPANGHTPGAAADCEHDQICTVCDAVLVSATGHDYEAVVTPPTCLAGGCTTHTCANCGDAYTDCATEALGHEQQIREEILVGATHAQAGSKKITTGCSRCDVVFSEETVEIPAGNRSIVVGTSALSVGANTANAAMVYYGSGNPWSVIGYNGAGVASGEGNLTLFSRAIYDVYYFSDTTTNGNKYAGSWLKKAIDRVAADNFSAAELAAVVRRDLNTYTVWQGSGDNKVTCDGIAGDPVLGAALWPLSTNELSAIPKNANLRLPLQAFAYVDGNGNNKTTRMFWLRSPGNYATTSTAVGYLYNDSTISSSGNRSGRYGAVPAFNLNLDSVLFASAATGGKAASGIHVLEAYSGNQWKLTLLDSTRTFAVTDTVISGDSVTLSYTGAATGDNEYISVLVADSAGTYTHYGRVAAVTAANGTVTIDLSGVDVAGKTLYVFNEQYNGGEADTTKLTDYASAPIAISLAQ